MTAVTQSASFAGFPLAIDDHQVITDFVRPYTRPVSCPVDSLSINGKRIFRTVRIYHVMAPRTVSLKMNPLCIRKRGSWWPFRRRIKRKQPSFRMMMAEFVIRGPIELLEIHPRYKERKAYLLSRGFRFDGKIKAWVPDPDRKPAFA